MKKLFSLAASLMLTGACVMAQPCSTFENPSPQGSWVNLNSSVSYGSPNPFDGSQFITLSDQAGGSWFYNTQNFRSLGSNFLHDCLCFDYNVGDDGFPGTSVPIHPTIYMSMGPTKYAYFEAFVTVYEGTSWVHVCAPLELSGSSGLPSNADGQWFCPTGSVDFDSIMNFGDQISFLVDVAGSSYQTEKISLDNICVVPCNNPCTAFFNVTTTFGTITSGATANVNIVSPSATSTYIVDWGDGSPVTSPFVTHNYTVAGSYVICVTEYGPNNEVICKNCIDFCFGLPFSGVIKKAATPDPATSSNNGGGSASSNFSARLFNKKFVDEQYAMFPNPSKDYTELQLNANKGEKIGIRVMDIFGKVVSEINEKTVESGSKTIKINTENLSVGVYIVEITVGDRVSSQKLSVAK